jgi:hypothetical protein
MENPPAIAVVSSAENIPSSATTGTALVLVGELADGDKGRLAPLIDAARNVLLLNPTAYPQELGLKTDAKNKIKVIVSEFSQAAAMVGEWRQVAAVQVNESAGDYLLDWDAILIKELAD